MEQCGLFLKLHIDEYTDLITNNIQPLKCMDKPPQYTDFVSLISLLLTIGNILSAFDKF